MFLGASAGTPVARESVAYRLPFSGDISALVRNQRAHGRTNMGIGTILIVLLILILIGALPTWPYSSGWGPEPRVGPRTTHLDHSPADGLDEAACVAVSCAAGCG
jgi:Protein of unknown function (DUF3309)